MVTLDLSNWKAGFSLNWIPVERADWDKPHTIYGGRQVEIVSEYNGDAFAVLTISK